VYLSCLSNVYCTCSFFTNLDLFCIDNTSVIYRKIRYLGDQIKKNEMGGARSIYGERRSLYRILVRKTEGKGHLEDPGIDERIILRWIFSRWDGGHGLA